MRGAVPLSADRIGLAPRAPLPPSDHHGVTMELAFDGRHAIGTEATSACVVPLPRAAAALVEPLRRRFDPRRWRWPPHLTLIHPLATARPPAASTAALRRAVGEIPTDRIAFDRTAVLGSDRRGTATVVALPDRRSAAALARIHAACCAALGEPCPPDTTFHLTLARVDARDVPLVRSAAAPLLPLPSPLDRIEIWSRDDDQNPMSPTATAPLHDTTPSTPSTPSLAAVLDTAGVVPTPQRSAAASEAVRRCERSGFVAEVVGSTALETALPEGDIDLAVRAPDPRAAATRLADAFGGRTVDGAVQTVRWSAQGWAYDAVVLPPGEPGPEGERDGVLAAVPPEQRPTFQIVTRALKAWAEARQIGDPAFGFFGGLAWTIAVAATTPTPPPPPTPPPGSSPPSSASSTPAPSASAPPPSPPPPGIPPTIAPVYTTAAPRQIVARHLMPSTAAIAHAEIERALVLAWDARWRDLYRPLFGPAPGPALRATFTAADPDARAAALGWLRRRAAALQASLAPTAAEVRPWPRPVARRGGFEVAWGLTDPDRAAVVRAVDTVRDRWLRSEERPEGVDLDLALRWT